MNLSSLEVKGVRNLKQASVAPGPGINLLFGDNGAGKTSLLESIFILAHGRSFRAGKIQTVINSDLTELSVTGCVENKKLDLSTRIGIMRGRDFTKARIDGMEVNRMSDLAIALPCVVISVKNHELIEGGPSERRSYLDWLLFHVEQSNLRLYRRYKNSLQQRNAAIRAGSSAELISSWDVELADAGQQITDRRDKMVEKISAKLADLVVDLDDELKPTLTFRRGWSSDQQFLTDALRSSLSNCQRTGMTTVGPHRADLKIMLGRNEAKYVNSRGQQKLLAIILKLVQVDLFAEFNQQTPIILIDDPPSELDQFTRQFVFNYLQKTPAQVFITSVDDVSSSLQSNINMFHVKRGTIQKVVY